MHCHNQHQFDLAGLISRRQLFHRAAAGFTGTALGAMLLADHARAGAAAANSKVSPPQYAPKARAVIQLFQHGGPSHMDLLDPKPELNKRDGQPMPSYFTDLVAITAHGGLMGTPYKFARHGQGGVEFSEILPYTAECADDIAVVRSMHTEHNNHEQALWMMHTGRIVTGRPTLGSWVYYALGSENENLPAYVVFRDDGNLPVDGDRNWSSGFLPPKYAGVHFRHSGTPVLHLEPTTPLSNEVKKLRLDLLKKLNDEHRAANPAIDEKLEARIASYELAGRMQTAAADALDLERETAETHELYGLNDPTTASYGRRCLMARRLVERGVRFVQIFIRGQMWDTHADNAKTTKQCCLETDRPTAALLKDLKRLGLLDSTLVVWTGEFGRTPVSQGGAGRDHHKQGFSLWLAGGGIRGGQAYGATDELGYHAVENRTKVSDLHATILHLLGLDHKQVNYHIHGRDERLTDVYDAKVLQALLA